MTRTRGVLTWIGTAVLVALAAVAVATAPDSEQISAPIEVTGVQGETIETRQLDVTITGLSTAAELGPTYAEIRGTTETSGVWLVVDATLLPKFGNESVAQTELHVGAVRYRASTVLPSPSLASGLFEPGLPIAGSLVFELPAAALTDAGANAARIVFRSGLTAVPDSMAVVVVDLTGLRSTGVASIEAATVVDQ